jgi:hypothetical protein
MNGFNASTGFLIAYVFGGVLAVVASIIVYLVRKNK